MTHAENIANDKNGTALPRRTGSSNGSDKTEPVLRTEGIVKRYPGTTALDGVDFNVYPGCVNVLIGENGAGKSTLTRILAGIESPTSGQLLLRDQSIAPASPREGRALGIGVIHQELTLFPNLSVSENLFTGRELVSGVGTVQHGKQKEVARTLMARLEQDISPDTLVEDLRIGQQQLVEIARALAEDVSILIMDEPTSALSRAETEILLRIVGELTAQGVAIVYISHKLDECLRIGDRFTVLRDGRLVAEAPAQDVSLAWIVENMSGRSEGALFRKEARTIGEPVLRVENLSLPRPHGGGYLIKNVSFTVRAGEAVGIYGLMGAGRTELLECLLGMHPDARGSVFLGARSLAGLRIDERLQAGLALIPEDRQRLGVLRNMSVAKNISLAALSRFTRGPALSGRRENREVRRMIETLGIRVSSARQSIATLSGGNQQKAVVAKSLLTQPRVLMMDEPTRGIDVAAKSDIFHIVDDLAAQGMGILFVSSELKEVIALADRALVMARGRLTAALEGKDITEQHLADASVIAPSTEHPNEQAA